MLFRGVVPVRSEVGGCRQKQNTLCQFIAHHIWKSIYLLTDPPSAPEGPIQVTDLNENSVVITWKPPLDNGGLDLTGYAVERRDRKWSSWMKVQKLDSETLTLTIDNLIEGNEYLFRIFAENPEGRSQPLEMDEAVLPRRKAEAPSAPIGPIRFNNVEPTTVTFDWLPPNDDGGAELENYTIEMAKPKEDFKQIGKVQGNITRYRAKDLEEGSKYTFRVRAVNRAGTSEPLESEAVIARKPPGMSYKYST